MIGAWYNRKSMDGQDRQLEIPTIEKFLAERKWTVPEKWRFDEIGYRDEIEKRDVWQKQVMPLVHSGKIDFLVVYVSDRIGFKNTMELNWLLYPFAQQGIKVYRALDGVDLTDTQTIVADFHRTADGIASRQEGVRKSSRLISKYEATARKGLRHGGLPPLGYDVGYYRNGQLLYRIHHYGIAGKRKYRGKLTDGIISGSMEYDGSGQLVKDWGKECKPKGKLWDNNIEPRDIPSIDPAEIECIQWLFKTYATSRTSRHKIAKEANRRGWSNRGNSFNHRNLSIILRNPIYKGLHRKRATTGSKFFDFAPDGKLQELPAIGPRKKIRVTPQAEWIEGESQGLVSPEIWEAVQTKLGTAKQDLAPQNPTYWLKGMLTCGNCGGKMTPAKRGNQASYVCLRHKKSIEAGLAPVCGTNRVTHAEIETRVLARIAELGHELRSTDDLKRIAEIRLQLTSQDDALGNLFAQSAADYLANESTELAAIKDELDPDIYQEAIDMLQEQKEALEATKDRRDFSANDTWNLVIGADKRMVEIYQERHAEIRRWHTKIIADWHKATPMMQETLAVMMTDYETTLEALKSKIVPITEKAGQLVKDKVRLVETLAEAETALQDDDLRIRAEAVRGLFAAIVVHCEKRDNAAPNNVRWKLESVDFQTRADICQLDSMGSGGIQLAKLILYRILAVG